MIIVARLYDGHSIVTARTNIAYAELIIFLVIASTETTKYRMIGSIIHLNVDDVGDTTTKHRQERQGLDVQLNSDQTIPA